MSQVFLVGGAVRDLIMGKDSHDKDYVVVGSSPEEMKKEGFTVVGADFPVFLHPETKDEYALARKEKKVGKGYLGFETYFSPDVTIEEDLFRRDLTINAIALNEETNEFIDPYNGIEDIKNKKLRHVSEAFKEDPLRILRIARFSARFPDFTIDESTMKLMREMHENKETKHLTKERIWKELSRALIFDNGSKFFSVLQSVGLGKDLFPDMQGFYNDKNINFNLARIHVSTFDKFLKNLTLKERIAQWSIPTHSQANLNISGMWASLSAPHDIVDHVKISCLLWNDILNNYNSLSKLKKPNLEFFNIIQSNDGYRRKDRFLEAYSTVKKHFEIISNNPNCIPDVSVISQWIYSTEPTKDEIAKVINNCDKSSIKDEVNKFKLEKQKTFISSFKSDKNRYHY